MVGAEADGRLAAEAGLLPKVLEISSFRNKVFNDFDTYIILIYLFNKVYQNYSDRFHYMSMDAFFEQEQITIDKLNLIEISKDLNIPKETIRRKRLGS